MVAPVWLHGSCAFVPEGLKQTGAAGACGFIRVLFVVFCGPLEPSEGWKLGDLKVGPSGNLGSFLDGFWLRMWFLFFAGGFGASPKCPKLGGTVLAEFYSLETSGGPTHDWCAVPIQVGNEFQL